jgi:hypothetical protein
MTGKHPDRFAPSVLRGDHWLTVVLAISVAAAGTRADSPKIDRFGGRASIPFSATGFFRTHYDGQRWWLVTPEGHAFLSVGVCCVRSSADVDRTTGRIPYRDNILARYGSIDAWTDVTRSRLRQWGFNTLAGWSGEEIKDMPRAICLSFCSGHSRESGLPDFFHPDFSTHAAKVADGIRHLRDNPWIIGYFLDNELEWAPHWRPPPPLFQQYVRRPAGTPGKKALVSFLRSRYASVQELSRVWAPTVQDFGDLEGVSSLHPVDSTRADEDREAFTYLVACRYFRVATEALREADPNHLILGSRFVSWLVPQAFVRACGQFCDVVSLNFYEVGPLARTVFHFVKPEVAFQIVKPDTRLMPPEADFKAYHEVSGKPILITEFSFRAIDSGLPNTFPPPLVAQPTVPTQQDRAERYSQYATMWISASCCVGFHWFQYQDQPKAGRSDGENGNYGLVTIDDEPYTAFVERISRINHDVWSLHQ